MTEILTTDAIQVPGGVAPWYGIRSMQFQVGPLDPEERVEGWFTFPRLAQILRVGSTHPAWIRLYATAQARTDDAARVCGVGLQNGRGLMTEVRTSAARPSISQSPILLFDNGDDPRINRLYVAIVNKDSVPRTPTITLIHLPLEE